VLLAAGQEITDKHVKIFKMWGVTDADVKGAEQEDMVVQDMAEVDPMTYQDAEQVTLDKFRHADMNHPGVKNLHGLPLCAGGPGMEGAMDRSPRDLLRDMWKSPLCPDSPSSGGGDQQPEEIHVGYRQDHPR